MPPPSRPPRCGSHREAAAQYARALRFADDLPPDERADLLERRTYECYLAGLYDEAVAAGQAAVDLRRETGDRRKEGDDLRWLSRHLWFAGRTDEAEQAAVAALAVLEALPPGPELAGAYSNLVATPHAHRGTRPRRSPGASGRSRWRSTWARPKRSSTPSNYTGYAKLMIEDEAGRALLERSLALARRHGYEDEVARALANLAGKRIRSSSSSHWPSATWTRGSRTRASMGWTPWGCGCLAVGSVCGSTMAIGTP